jgi:hypothetical protein
MNFIHSFNKILSLGSNCYVKMFLGSIKYSSETNFFDYIGSSMWSINELLKNDFNELFEGGMNNFEKKKIMNTGDKYILTHKKYHLRFKHEFKQKFNIPINDKINLEDFNKTKEKYERRKERLYEILNDKQTLLFIRYEEDFKNKVIYYEDKKSEIEYIYEFIEIIKQKFPLKKFCILFLSHTMENDKPNENLVILKNIDPINCWTESANKIKNTIDKNTKYL